MNPAALSGALRKAGKLTLSLTCVRFFPSGITESFDRSVTLEEGSVRRRGGVLAMSEDRRAYLLILTVTALLGVLVGSYALLRRAAPSGRSSTAAMSPEERAYLSQIGIADARMSAAKNYIGDTVIYLDARVSNSGPRTIRDLALALEFVNTENQIVFRSTARPIRSDTRPLEPHASRPFQVPFEKLPEDWNRAAPTIKPVTVRF